MRHFLPRMTHRFDVRHFGALSSLSINHLIGFIGSALVGIFLPIFLYEYFQFNLTTFLLWYIAAYAIRIPLLIWAAQTFHRIGLTAHMIIGSVTWALFYVTLFVLEASPQWQPMLVLGIGLFLQAIFASTYWAPFHVDFSHFSTRGRRGRQVSVLYATKDFLALVGPALGGWMVATFAYGAVFGAAIAIILASIVPLLFLPRYDVTYEFGFFESFRKLFAREFRPMSLAMMAHGAESIVATVMWPLFLFVLFDGAYLDIGIFASVLVLMGMLLQLGVGQWLDRHTKPRILAWGVNVYALGWLAKAFVDSVTGAFAASTFHSFGSIMMKTPLDVMTYDTAADAGHYIDEFTTLREVALTLGRVLMLVILIPVLSMASLSASFVVAAVVSLGITGFAKFTLKEHLPTSSTVR